MGRFLARTPQNGLYQKKSKQWRELRTWNFQGYWRKSMQKFQGSIKKEVEFPGVYKINRVFSMALGFWPWNFQGVSHNSVEFPGVKACFLWNFLGQSHKPKNSMERGRGVRKVYPQPPPPVRIFPGIAQCCQFCLKFWPWCIRYATVFIEVLWNGKNWDKKLMLGLILWVFLFTHSCTLRITLQDFAK